MLALTEEIGPSRVEFAHVQYYGWAFENRKRLLPTREELDRSLEIIKQAEARLRGRISRGIRRPGLLRKISQGLHGQLGTKGAARQAGWRRAAVPRRERPAGNEIRKRERAAAPPDLGRIGRVSEHSAARIRCRSLAGAAIAARRTISAAAAARRFCWRKTRRRPTRSARFRRCTSRSSGRRSRKPPSTAIASCTAISRAAPGARRPWRLTPTPAKPHINAPIPSHR